MGAGTGENEQGLRQVMDMTRLISVIMLLLHFYMLWNENSGEEFLLSEFLLRLPLGPDTLKQFSIGTALLCVAGSSVKKDRTSSVRMDCICLASGAAGYFSSHLLLQLVLTINVVYVYIAATSVFYLMAISGATRLARFIKLELRRDIFNEENETFPQEERLLQNEYSINLPAKYYLYGKERRSWINFINPFRSLLVIGTPGAGKSYFIIRHVITQHIEKGFSMFIYDFKYDDLSRIAYNTLNRFNSGYRIRPQFYVINFDVVYHRCNPLAPETMDDITDATESSRTIMLGLNRDWIKKQGDFFVESPINFVTAIIWFLKKFQKGIYCTLPHVIELMQLDYPTLFGVLKTEPEIEVLINPFESAFRNEAMEQLEGQVASAKIGMARLSSPQLYYVLSGNDFTLDINNPAEPKIVCMGNNPQKQQIYGAVLSLYITRVIKLINRKHQMKSSLIFDEFPTIYFNGIDNLIATARANKVATTLAVQDYSQLKKDYGRDQAEVIMNVVGNVISGQVTGETAKSLSERFGKIVQQRQSISLSSADATRSTSTQLEAAIPASKISTLSSGEFVGMVADDPQQQIKHKIFHCSILNDHIAIADLDRSFAPIPKVRTTSQQEILDNYYRIKEDIRQIVNQLKNGK
ncbi:MAG TPA: conjugal transfer protein MobC [Chryseosolibacter sp.]